MSSGMFKLQPFYNFDQVQLNLPDCMFKMASFQDAGNDQSMSDDPALVALEQRQMAILQDLQGMETEVAALTQKLSLDDKTVMPRAAAATAQAAASNIGSQCLHDVVICANPNNPPYSLLILYEQLKQQFRCTTHVHIHSSVTSVPDKLLNYFSQNGLSRGEAQIALTLIWKNVTHGPEMRIQASQSTAIQGEANILRYLTRLLTPAYDNADLLSLTTIDAFLDLASSSILHGNNKERAAAVRSLNSALGKRAWLVGDSLTLADVALWSALQQTGLATGAPANVQKWLKACAARNEFRTALSIIA